jgi:hypothetical protein
MLDDNYAEHIPGCNMAFKRHKLLGIGGFDAQFRAAGDDVDICWRFLDAGMNIGYASAALVWHRRRNEVKTYFKQQRGYGRSEALLHFKHPGRFNSLGSSRWRGIIYGEGAVGLDVVRPAVYHGRFGTGLFQITYRSNDYSPWAYFTLLEWHALAVMLLSLGIVWPPLMLGALATWSLTLAAGLRSTLRAPLPANAPWWCRPLVFAMYLTQPLVRAVYRYGHRLGNKRLPVIELDADDDVVDQHVKRVDSRYRDLYWTSNHYRGRAEFLDALVETAAENNWPGDFHAEWDENDVDLIGDRWHDVAIRAATEELGWPKRFTRVRFSLRPTAFAWTVAGAALLLTVESTVLWGAWAAGAAAIVWPALLGRVFLSRHQCRRAVSRLLWKAGLLAELEPVPLGASGKESSARVSRPVNVPARVWFEQQVPLASQADRRQETRLDELALPRSERLITTSELPTREPQPSAQRAEA